MTNSKTKILIVIVLVILILIALWFIGGLVNKQAINDQSLIQPVNQISFGEFYRQMMKKDPTIDNLVSQGLVQVNGQRKTLELGTGSKQKIYSLTDLIILDIEDKKSITNYGLNLADNLRPLAKKRENEIQIMIEALNQPDENKLIKITNAAKTYQQITDRLLATAVPPSAAPIHLSLINNTSLLSHLLFNMALVETEPLLGMESAKAYKNNLSRFFETIDQINSYFIGHNILFESNNQAKIYINVTP